MVLRNCLYNHPHQLRCYKPAFKSSETAELTVAPKVPATITRRHKAHVEVNLNAVEKVGQLADGMDYRFWTFNGSVPGPFIRVRVGDEVTLNLSNHPESFVSHNIDLHAVTGPGGGAMVTATKPGESHSFHIRRPSSRFVRISLCYGTGGCTHC